MCSGGNINLNGTTIANLNYAKKNDSQESNNNKNLLFISGESSEHSHQPKLGISSGNK